MSRGPLRVGRAISQRGASLVELMIATWLGVGLAALLAHTVTAFQTDYRRSVARIGADQQARLALSLIADELSGLLGTPAAASCPSGQVLTAPGRLEFAANLYDRSTRLRDAVPAGRRDIVVEPGGGEFEAGDLVVIVNVGVADDPGDDVAECSEIGELAAGRWSLTRPLARSFPARSPVALVNRVVYALDRQGRLMRTQDLGSQRVAQGVNAFDTSFEGSALVLRLAMREASAWTRRVVLKDVR